MSWGGSEFSAETSYDFYFAQSGVVYFASSGDSPGVIWPSASPNVVSVGGTSISRNPVSGDLQQEIAWQSGGGGASLYEARPGYQAGLSAVVGSRRGTPDVAADADPATGVWVYDYPYWYIVGGTSVAAPVWAGIVNAGNGFAATSQTELALPLFTEIRGMVLTLAISRRVLAGRTRVIWRWRAGISVLGSERRWEEAANSKIPDLAPSPQCRSLRHWPAD